MQNISTKVTGSTLTSTEFNDIPEELENIITSSGITLSGGDLDQLGKSVAEYVAGASFYVEDGTSAADVYVLDPIGSKKTPTQFFDGLEIVFRVTNTNTGASTIALPGLTAKNLKKDNGASDLASGDLSAGQVACFRYDSSAGYFELMWTTATSTESLPRGYIDGLIMSNDTDSDHDIAISVGETRSSDDTTNIPLSAIITKQIDASWVAGDDAGGFPSGLSLSSDTWYHVFVIYNPTTGDTDAGFDTSISATNLLSDATGYTKYRRIGSVLTDGSSNIYAFHQDGDIFTWDAPKLDVDVTSSATPTNYTVSTPPDVVCIARMNMFGGAITYHVYPTTVTDQATSASFVTFSSSAGSNTVPGVVVPTNTSSQIRTVASGGTGALDLLTISYQDFRGKE